MSGPVFTIDDKAPASATADKPRRGRPPGSKNKSTSTGAPRTEAANLRQALSTMESLYQATAAGLTLFGLTSTAELWIAQTETLKATNAQALEASPKLAAAIANVGSVGGAATFFSAHIMAVAPVMLMARAELAMRRAPSSSDADADATPDNITRIPGA